MGKLKKLRNELEKHGLEAILITSPINRRYMTGFTGTAGAAIITGDKARFITDFRYTKQAEEQAKQFDVIEHKQSIEKEIKDQLKDMNIKRLAFEKKQVTYANYELYKNTFDVDLITSSVIIESLRMIKFHVVQ